jgi:hypothetical protein
MFNRYAKKHGGLNLTDIRLNGVGPIGPIRDGVLIKPTILKWMPKYLANLI